MLKGIYALIEDALKESPVYVKWDTPGVEVSGDLVSLKEVETRYGKARVAMVRTEYGIEKFYATPLLAGLLIDVPVGSTVTIKYLGTVRRRKMFEVSHCPSGADNATGEENKIVQIKEELNVEQ